MPVRLSLDRLLRDPLWWACVVLALLCAYPFLRIPSMHLERGWSLPLFALLLPNPQRPPVIEALQAALLLLAVTIPAGLAARPHALTWPAGLEVAAGGREAYAAQLRSYTDGLLAILLTAAMPLFVLGVKGGTIEAWALAAYALSAWLLSRWCADWTALLSGAHPPGLLRRLLAWAGPVLLMLGLLHWIQGPHPVLPEWHLVLGIGLATLLLAPLQAVRDQLRLQAHPTAQHQGNAVHSREEDHR